MRERGLLSSKNMALKIMLFWLARINIINFGMLQLLIDEYAKMKGKYEDERLSIPKEHEEFLLSIIIHLIFREDARA